MVRSITPEGGLMDNKGKEVALAKKDEVVGHRDRSSGSAKSRQNRIRPQTSLRRFSQSLMLCIRRQTGKVSREDERVYASQFNRITSELSRLRDSWRMEAGQRRRWVSEKVWKVNSDRVREVHAQLQTPDPYPSEEYRDYLQYMEAKVYKDLMGTWASLWRLLSSVTKERNCS